MRSSVSHFGLISAACLPEARLGTARLALVSITGVGNNVSWNSCSLSQILRVSPPG